MTQERKKRSCSLCLQEDSEAVAELLANDVLQGFLPLVSPDLISNLAHAMVQPTAGGVKQFLLQEKDREY